MNGTVREFQISLAEIDRQTAETLQDMAETIAQDVISRLRTRVNVAAGRRSRGVQEQVRQATASLRMDRAVFAAVGVDEQEFVSRAFIEFEAATTTIFERARRRKLRLARLAAKQLGIELPPDVLIVDEQQSKDAAGILRWALVAWVLRTVQAGDARIVADDEPEAEKAVNRKIPVGVYREAFNTSRVAPTADVASRGLATSLVASTLSAALIAAVAERPVSTVGFTWIWGFYGEPARPFPPHESLAGLFVNGRDDDLLVNPNDFPEPAYYEPGDHYGCLCELVETVLDE